jgi:hypothetical protein
MAGEADRIAYPKAADGAKVLPFSAPADSATDAAETAIPEAIVRG